MISQQIRSVEILGVPIACITREGLFHTVFTWAAQAEKRTICYANAHVLNTAKNDHSLLSILKQADLVYADGISVVLAGRYLYNITLEKLTARAWIHDFAARAAKNGTKLYLFGGMQGVSQRAATQLNLAHPDLQIVGCEAGVFSPDQEKSIVDQINQAQPDILFVGLGSPLQEKWMERNRHALVVPVCWGVGALFDYLAGDEKPVPARIDQLGLEWLWRLGMNPRGKWMRYLLGNPLFLWRILRQKANRMGMK